MEDCIAYSQILGDLKRSKTEKSPVKKISSSEIAFNNKSVSKNGQEHNLKTTGSDLTHSKLSECFSDQMSNKGDDNIPMMNVI